MNPSDLSPLQPGEELLPETLALLRELWEAALQARFERFRAYPTDGENRVGDVLRKLDAL